MRIGSGWRILGLSRPAFVTPARPALTSAGSPVQNPIDLSYSIVGVVDLTAMGGPTEVENPETFSSGINRTSKPSTMTRKDHIYFTLVIRMNSSL